MRTTVHWTHCLPSSPASPTRHRIVADQDGQWFALLEALGQPSATTSTLDVAEEALRTHPPTAELGAANASVQATNAAVYRAQSTTDAIGSATVSITLAALRGTRAVLAQVGRTGASVLRRGDARAQPCTTPDTAVDERLRAGLGWDASRATSDERFVLTRGLGSLPEIHPRSRLIELMPGGRLVLRSCGIEAVSIRTGEDGAALSHRLASKTPLSSDEAESVAVVIDVRGMLESYLERSSNAGRLNRHPIAARVGGAPWRRLCGLGQFRHLTAGQVLLHRGQPVDRLFAVTGGSLRVEQHRCERVLGRGALLFPDALLSSAPSGGQVSAIGSASLLEVPRSELTRGLARSPMVGLRAVMRLWLLNRDALPLSTP